MPWCCRYELPAIFNAVMLQYRVDHGTCVHRLFRSDNSSIWNDGWGYGGLGGEGLWWCVLVCGGQMKFVV
jgi:hypothetical protein